MKTDEQEPDADFTYDVAPDESLSRGVVKAVAAVSGADPVPTPAAASGSEQVLEPLFTAIDPEALDAVFRPAGADEPTDGRISFTYQGYDVTVHGEGRIAVSRPRLADQAAD